MTSANETLLKFQKEHGAKVGKYGNTEYEDVPRIPTGIFPVDLSMGGGFPMSRCSIVYGPESSNKTNLVLCAIANAQRMYPGKMCVFVDAEYALDLKWATNFGVDAKRLIVINPETAEQVVDIIDGFMYATDVSVIVLDSIAAITTAKEIENSAEVASVGGASLLVGKLYRKVVRALNAMANKGQQPPAFIAINQIRSKIGVMYGNPETMPGGNPPKFASSMTVRVYGKNVMDNKVSKTMPAFKEVNCVIQKWKVPIVAVASTYTMQMIKANGRSPGYVDDWNTISSYLKELDYLGKGKKGWEFDSQEFQTLDAVRTHIYETADRLASVKATIISDLVGKGLDVMPSGEEPPSEQ